MELKRIYCLLLLLLAAGSFSCASTTCDTVSRSKLRETYYWSRIKDPTVFIEDKLSAYDSLIRMHSGSETEICKLYREKSLLLERLGRYSSALLANQAAWYGLDSLCTSPTIPDSVHCTERWLILYDMARLSLNLGFYEQSASYLYDILSDTASGKNLQVRAYSLLSLVYINWNRLFHAEKYLEQAEDLIRSFPETDTLALFDHASISGAWFYTSGKYDSALLWMERAGEYANRCGEKTVLTWNYNMANIYLDMGETELAKKNLNHILETGGDKYHVSYMGALSAQNMAYIYFLEKDYPSALAGYERAVELAGEIGAKKITGSCWLELAEVYKALGNCEEAWNYQQKGYRLKDSVFSAMALEEILLRNNNFVQQKRELEKQIVIQKLLVSDLQNKNKTIVLSVLFVLLLVFLVLLILSLRRLYRQSHTNSTLYREWRESSVRLNADIDLKNRKLAKNYLMLAQSNELFSLLATSIKKLKAMNINSGCREIVDEMDTALSAYKSDQNWEEFTLYFERIHPGFFDEIGRKYKQLTLNEQRICALICLNLSAKEIAAMTFRSVRTVETVIHSIRKKLNIPADEKTRLFLTRELKMKTDTQM